MAVVNISLQLYNQQYRAYNKTFSQTFRMLQMTSLVCIVHNPYLEIMAILHNCSIILKDHLFITPDVTSTAGDTFRYHLGIMQGRIVLK